MGFVGAKASLKVRKELYKLASSLIHPVLILLEAPLA
jgi:hypothetical protein